MEREYHVGEKPEDEQLDAEDRCADGADRDDLVSDPVDKPAIEDVRGHNRTRRGRYRTGATEVEQGVIRFRLPVQFDEDHAAVANRVEIRRGATGPLAVGDGDDLDRESVFDALDGHLCLDPKPVGGEVQSEERLTGERAVAGEDVPVVLAVNGAKREVDQSISDLVQSGHRARPHVREPVPDDVVGLAGQQRIEHRVDVRGVVGRVGVSHHDVGSLDVIANGLPNRLSLSPPGLFNDARARLASGLLGPVRRSAVDHEDLVESGVVKRVDDAPDRLDLVHRGQQDADVVVVAH